jgi:hypothetical protein
MAFSWAKNSCASLSSAICMTRSSLKISGSTLPKIVGTCCSVALNK